MTAPLFSVVIPTRNRSHLLRSAIRCVLAQEFEDFELIVSDNDSSDDTRDVVGEFSDARLSYVRTPGTLHMPDSWEFALSQARGRYVTYVSDDDGVTPRLLGTIHEALTQSGLDIVAWPFGGTYHHDTCDEVALRNTLTFQPMDGRREEVSAASILAELSAVRFTHKFPRFINSCASAGVLAEVRAKFGRVFLPKCPDYSSAVAQLAVRPSLAYVNELVLIWGIGKESIGYAQTKGGEASRAFLDELRADNADRTRYVPMKVYTAMNFAIDSMLYVKDLAGGALSKLEVDRRAYYSCVGRELVALERNGLNVGEQFEEMRQALEREKPEVKAQIKREFYLLPGGHFLRRARTLARRGIDLVRQKIGGQDGSIPVQVHGSENGFNNVYEAMIRLDGMARARALPSR